MIMLVIDNVNGAPLKKAVSHSTSPTKIKGLELSFHLLIYIESAIFKICLHLLANNKECKFLEQK